MGMVARTTVLLSLAGTVPPGSVASENFVDKAVSFKKIQIAVKGNLIRSRSSAEAGEGFFPRKRHSCFQEDFENRPPQGSRADIFRCEKGFCPDHRAAKAQTG